MSEDGKHPGGKPGKAQGDESPIDQLESLGREVAAGEVSATDRFRKTSQVAMLMAYDLIDKLRYWEKQTLELPDAEISKRLPHLVDSVDQLRAAYLTFTDLDL